MILKDNFHYGELSPLKRCVMCGKPLCDDEETFSEICVCNNCKDIL